MRFCSEAPHLCWMFWLLSTSLLLNVSSDCFMVFASELIEDTSEGICSAGVESSGEPGSAEKDSGVHVSLKRIQGGSVLFQMENSEIYPGTQPLDITWRFMKNSASRRIVQVKVQYPLTEDNPNWSRHEDKQRMICVPSNLSLRIENLTHEDTGKYEAEITLSGGEQFKQVFFLTVYEPVPFPKILVQSKSITRDWCNITLECTALGATEDLKVTWESKYLSMKQEQRVTPGSAPNPWTLAMSLPLSQPDPSLTCVVSNQVEQNNITTRLVEVCRGPDRKSAIRSRILIIVMVMAVVILGFGLYLWITCWKKRLETQRGARTVPVNSEDSIRYADIIHPVNQESQYETIGQRQMENQESYTTVYSKVCIPVQPAELT